MRDNPLGTVEFWVLIFGLGLLALGPAIMQFVRWRSGKDSDD